MCASFDGVNDGLNLAGGINWLNGKSAATMCAWVQRKANTAANQEFLFLMVNAGVGVRMEMEYDVPDAGAGGPLSVYAQAGDADPLEFGQSAAGVLPVDTGTPGTWVHCCVVVDVPGDTIRTYVNGVQSSSTAVTFGGATFSASVLGPENTIAFQRNGAAKFEWFNGTLSDLRLYERALTAAEILCMAKMRGHDGIRGSLVLKFNFNGQRTIGLSTVNVLNACPAPLINSFTSLESAPVFGADTVAFRRRT
jgi:hypothetical protein